MNKKRLKVLLVEDDNDIRLFIKEIMIINNTTVLEAADGQEGLQLYKKHLPDIIITDIMMPRINGLEMVRQIRKNEKKHNTYILMLSALEDVKNRIQGIKAGADDYMAKPFNTEELLVKIKAAFKIINFQVQLNDSKNNLQNLLDKLNRELSMAKEIHLKQFKPHYSIDKAKISTKYIPCEHLGADFFEVIQLNNTNWAIIMADTSGHGLEGTIISTLFKDFIHQVIASGYSQPNICLKKVNNKLQDMISSGHFITAFYGIYNSKKLTLEYATAGLYPPMLFRENRELTVPTNSGIPLGVKFTDEDYIINRINLNYNDILLIFSDGLSECLNSDRKMFGTKSISEAILKNSKHSINKIIANLMDNLCSFNGSNSYNDDVTIMGIKFEN